MGHSRKRSSLPRWLAAAAAFASLVAAAASLATRTPAAVAAEARPVPPSERLIAHQVGPSTTLQATSAAAAVAARVRNPSAYAAAKSAADRSLAAWAASHPAAATPAQPQSVVGLNQPGLTAGQSGGSTPPDPTGAIGPASYVELVNSEIAVYSRTTLASPPIAMASEDAFTGSTGTCDGQTKWDQAAQRFEYWSLDCRAAATSNGFSIGWSKTASPTPLTGASANWCRFHFNTGSLLEDYGKLGNSNGFMIVGANEFNGVSQQYVQSPIFAVPKPANKSTTCPASVSATKFTPAAANEFTPEPANIFGSSVNGFVVAISGNLNNALRMYTLNGTSPPTLTDNGNISVAAFSTPANVPQPGSTDRIDSSDTRLTQANAAYDPVLKAFAVWTQHTIAGPGGGPSVVRWYELRAGRTTPVQTGTVAVSGAYAFNAAIAPNSAGNAAAIEYNVGSATMQVQLRARVHPPGSAAGSMSSETTLAASSGIARDFSCPSQAGTGSSCRWGDYAGASTDPSGCGAYVWGTNESNGAPDSAADARWKTQNFRLQVDECPTAAFSVTTPSPVHGSRVQFEGSASGDTDGSIVSYTWLFGDGATLTTASATPSHTYSAAGTYTVTLTVHDSAGLHATVSHSISVA